MTKIAPATITPFPALYSRRSGVHRDDQDRSGARPLGDLVTNGGQRCFFDLVDSLLRATKVEPGSNR